MSSPAKKLDKAREKHLKKQSKAELKGQKKQANPRQTSLAVLYSEAIRGGLSLLLGGSILVALLLGQRGAIVSLDDVIESLFAAVAGKLILALIGLAMVLYGLKYLRLIR